MDKGSKVVSAKGEVVDFDLLRVKSSMEGADKPQGVSAREQYIDIRRRRNPRRSVSDLVNDQRNSVDDARDKIRKSKENASLATATTTDDSPEPIAGDGHITVEDVINTGTPESAKRKIVKKTPKGE